MMETATPVAYKEFVKDLSPADQLLLNNQLAPAIFEGIGSQVNTSKLKTALEAPEIFASPAPAEEVEAQPEETPTPAAELATAEAEVATAPAAAAERAETTIPEAIPAEEVEAQPKETPATTALPEPAETPPDIAGLSQEETTLLFTHLNNMYSHLRPRVRQASVRTGLKKYVDTLAGLNPEQRLGIIIANMARVKTASTAASKPIELASPNTAVKTAKQEEYDTHAMPLNETQIARLDEFISKLRDKVYNYEKTFITGNSATGIDAKEFDKKYYANDPEMLELLETSASASQEAGSRKYYSSALHRLLFAYRIKTLLAPSSRDQEITAGQDLVNQILEHMNDSDKLLYKKDLGTVVLALKSLSQFDIETIGQSESKQGEQVFKIVQRNIYPEPTYNYTHKVSRFSFNDTVPFHRLAVIGTGLLESTKYTQIASKDLPAYDLLANWVLSLQDSTSEPATPAEKVEAQPEETPATTALPEPAAAAEPVEQPATAETVAPTAAVPEQKAPPVTRTKEQIVAEAKQSLEKKGNWSSRLKPNEVGIFIKELFQPLGLTADTISLGNTYTTEAYSFSTVMANGVSDSTQTNPTKLESVKFEISSPKIRLGEITTDFVRTDTDPPPDSFDTIADKINDQLGGDKIIQGLESAAASLLEIDQKNYYMSFTLWIDSETEEPVIHIYISKKVKV